MSLSKLTLIGMNSYFKTIDSDLFEHLALPEGINKDTLVNNILLEGGEFETLYGDPYFMQQMIGTWSDKWERTFEKWVSALSIEYAPLENYDRMEDWDDTLNRGVKSSARRDSGNTRTFDNQDKRTIDTENKQTLDTENKRTINTENKRTLDTGITVEETVSAFDSSTYQPSQKSETSNDGTDTMENTGTDTMTNTGTDTMTNTGTDTVDYSGTIKDVYGEGTSGQETENRKDIHSGRIHGNIGTLTSQKMLADELDLQKWNLYEHITDLFMQEFCIMVYD